MCFVTSDSAKSRMLFARHRSRPVKSDTSISSRYKYACICLYSVQRGGHMDCLFVTRSPSNTSLATLSRNKPCPAVPGTVVLCCNSASALDQQLSETEQWSRAEGHSGQTSSSNEQEPHSLVPGLSRPRLILDKMAWTSTYKELCFLDNREGHSHSHWDD